MDWVDIREKHLKISSSVLTAIVFLKVNWGSTLAAIKHIVLSARAHSLHKVEGELASELGAGVLPFGHTVAHLVVCGVILCCILFLIKTLNLDSIHDTFKIKELQRDNERLRQSLASTNTAVFDHLKIVSQLTAHSPKLERHHDQILQLSVEIEKCSQKTRSKEKPKPIEALPEPDLFRGLPAKGKPPRRAHSAPKF